jgi:hypothetical protein
MEKVARDMRLVSHSADGLGLDGKGPLDPGLSSTDLDAARELGEFHRLLAAELPAHSQVRGLVLRCGGHWSRLGAVPRNGLAGVKARQED